MHDACIAGMELDAGHIRARAGGIERNTARIADGLVAFRLRNAVVGIGHAGAALRGVKAEGGWGIVNSEYCSIDPSSDDMPAPFASLWDEGDQANMAAMAEAVHRHGALAGVELWHGGLRSSNLQSREAPIGPASYPVASDPWQCATMDGADLKAIRRWHRAAALRAKAAGFDIGAAWKKTSEAGREYISVTLDDPSFPATVYARLIEGENGT